MTTIVDYDDLLSLAGSDLGTSDWIDLTQQRIDTFADATDDHQWIHVDRERALLGPFGGTIAHGFLTLALIAPMLGQLLDVRGANTTVNYGLDKVRFVSPVPAGSRVRLRGNVVEVLPIASGFHLTTDVVVETEFDAKPSVVARTIQRFYQ